MNYKRFEELPCWQKARELCQAVRALDCKYIFQDQFDKVYELASECRKQIKGFRKYLRDYDAGKVEDSCGDCELRNCGIKKLSPRSANS